ncbi:hypothetical protein P4O66_020442, partial [Electrophorus voltai]
MTTSQVKPKPGDLIEIFRGTYQHWVIYDEKDYIIHLVRQRTSVHAQGGSCSMSMQSDMAVVKKEQLQDVVGTDRYTVNNLLDDKYKPRPVELILQDAHSLLGQELPYSVFSENCEHLVTEMRYGKAESRQVQNAVDVGVGMGVATSFGVGALPAAVATTIFSWKRRTTTTTLTTVGMALAAWFGGPPAAAAA